MGVQIQHVSITKRISAFLLDTLLLLSLATGAASGLFRLFGYDNCTQTVQAAYDRYGEAYGVTLPVDMQTYEALPEEERAVYDRAYADLNGDTEAVRAKKMADQLPLLVVTLALLAAYLLLEFTVPLLFGNGQTLGKKFLSMAVVDRDGVKISAVQLFVRTFLGKYTLGTMLPAYLLILTFTGRLGLLGTVLLGLLVLTQAVLLLRREHILIEDWMAHTAVADMASQQIFQSRDELIEYVKRIHAEQAQRETY